MPFLGPADYGILAGIPGQMDHPNIQAAMEQTASTAKAASNIGGMPIFSPDHAKQVLELCWHFLCHGCDLLMVKAGSKKFNTNLRRLESPLIAGFDSLIPVPLLNLVISSASPVRPPWTRHNSLELEMIFQHRTQKILNRLESLHRHRGSNQAV